MTITYGPRGRIVEFDLADTVGFLLPPEPEPEPEPDRSWEETQRLGIPHRRPTVDPERHERRVRIRSIGVVGEPLLTTELPALVEYSLRPRRPDNVPPYVGRHHKPGRFARLLRWIRFARRGGAR